MNFVEDEQPRYKKKSQKKPPAKSNHKHNYQPCVFEYNSIEFSKGKGFVQKPDAQIGNYCTVCGKIDYRFDSERWVKWVQMLAYPTCGKSEYTEEAKKELNPETRTLPTFWVDDIWKQKFVKLGECDFTKK